MKKLKENDGFSLMEVMVSIIILTLSLLLLLNMTMVALDGNDWSNKATLSTQLIQEKLEDLRTGMNLTNGIDTINDIERNWRIDSVSNHLRKISVIASWLSARGDTLQNTITTYIRTDSV